MNQWQRLDYQRVSLKSDCQMLMRTIIRNETSHQKQGMNLDGLQRDNSLISNQRFLEQLDSVRQLLSSDSPSNPQWVNHPIHQDPHNKYHIDEWSPSIFNFKAYQSMSIPQVKFEDGSSQLNQKPTQWVFFDQINTYTMVICSIDEYSSSDVKLTVRNLEGQIIYLSFCSRHQKKMMLFQRFCQKVESRIFLFVVDSIDYRQQPESQMKQDEVKSLCDKFGVVYLRRQIDQKASEMEDYMYSSDVRYSIKFNSLVSSDHNFYIPQQLGHHQISISQTIQKLLQYFFELAREEIDVFGDTRDNDILNKIIFLNYKRELQSFYRVQNIYSLDFKNYFQEQNDKIVIKMQKKIKNDTADNFHFPINSQSNYNCFYCLFYRSKTKMTSFLCEGCKINYQVDVNLCPDCFQPFHNQIQQYSCQSQVLDYFNQHFKNKQKIQFNQISNNMQGSLENASNQMAIELSNIQEQRSQAQILNSGQIQRMTLQLSRQKKMIQLQKATEKYLKLFKKLKANDNFYKAIHVNPCNRQEYQQDLRDQLIFIEYLQIQRSKQIQIFHGSTLILDYEEKEKREFRIQQIQNRNNPNQQNRFDHFFEPNQDLRMVNEDNSQDDQNSNL